MTMLLSNLLLCSAKAELAFRVASLGIESSSRQFIYPGWLYGECRLVLLWTYALPFGALLSRAPAR